MHASLGSGIGDIAQLVERRPCNWVVALTGWMPNCLGGNVATLLWPSVGVKPNTWKK
jgi:hypothetical protein